MNKAYSRINWENEPSENTPINETNLNKMDAGINELDNRIVSIDTQKAKQSDLLQSLKTLTFDSATGRFIFTYWNGTTLTADINVEKIPVSFEMSPEGIITMTTEDGTEYTADIASLIKNYTFDDSNVITFNVTTDQDGNKHVVADIANGSITGDKLEPNYLADVLVASQNAQAAAGSAFDDALVAEGYANGTQSGRDVDPTSPYYHNNARYWKEQAQAVTNVSLEGLSDTEIDNPTDRQALVYDAGTGKWVNGDASSAGITVIDNLQSTNADDALSANQGRVLKNLINIVESDLSATENTLLTVEAKVNKGVSVEELTNAEITSPTNEQALIFDAAKNKWVNKDVALPIAVIDDLQSTSSTDALSANQGRLLKSDIDAVTEEVADAVKKSDIATTVNVGIVKPDGTSIKIDPDGTIHGEGGGSASIDSMTKAEYDALPASKDSDNVMRVITDEDIPNMIPTADKVKYGNQNVAQALDGLNSNLTQIETKIENDVYVERGRIKTVGQSVTLPNSFKEILLSMIATDNNNRVVYTSIIPKSLFDSYANGEIAIMFDGSNVRKTIEKNNSTISVFYNSDDNRTVVVYTR